MRCVTAVEWATDRKLSVVLFVFVNNRLYGVFQDTEVSKRHSQTRLKNRKQCGVNRLNKRKGE